MNIDDYITRKSLKSRYLEKNIDIDIYRVNENKKEDLLKYLEDKILDLYCHPIRIIGYKKDYPNDWLRELYTSHFPITPHIISGDFGEIFTFLLLQFLIEYNTKKTNYEVNSIKKWRFKYNKESTMSGTDILFWQKQPNKDYLEKFFIQSVEAKVHSNNNNPADQITASIDGAGKDYLTRIASTFDCFGKICRDRVCDINTSDDDSLKKECEEYRTYKKEIELYAQSYKQDKSCIKYIYALTIMENSAYEKISHYKEEKYVEEILKQSFFYQKDCEWGEKGKPKEAKKEMKKDIDAFITNMDRTNVKFKIIIVTTEKLKDFYSKLYNIEHDLEFKNEL